MKLEDLHKYLGRKWSIPILDLLDRKGRLNNKDIDKHLGIPSDTLSETLTVLQEPDWITREEYKRNDVRYQLTEEGEKTINRLREIVD